MQRGSILPAYPEAALQGEAPGEIFAAGGVVDVFPFRDFDLAGCAVFHPQGAGHEVRTVEGAVDGHGEAEAARAAGKERAPRFRPPLPDERQPFHRLARPEKDAARGAFGVAADVEAAVHAVDEINVRAAGLAEDHFRPRRASPERMGPVVGLPFKAAAVGFRLRNADRCTAFRRFPDEERADQFPRRIDRTSLIVFSSPLHCARTFIPSWRSFEGLTITRSPSSRPLTMTRSPSPPPAAVTVRTSTSPSAFTMAT